LAVEGERVAEAGPATAEWLRRLDAVPDAQVRTIAGAGHLVTADQSLARLH
jgi:hypothetical protein